MFRTRIILFYIKKRFYCSFRPFLSGIITAQQGIIDPETWESSITNMLESEYDVILTGSTGEDWHVFLSLQVKMAH
ncbi:hypothetical protein [Nonlabens xiamenensis]|uniref:hypothetical protein n=1 Tax=Nonlabens xiamenensis TaxID=2341043 RepID=UPI000F613D66|nr:hypothetical protein [Nonlabens xiamenensis]